MSESSFWGYLRKVLPKDGHFTRVESHDTAAGVPDVLYTLTGNMGVIELKDAKRPGSKFPFSGVSGLRKNQILWMRAEFAAGADNVFLGLQCGDRVYFLRAELYYDELYHMTEEDVARVASVSWQKRVAHNTDITRELHDLLEGTL